MSCDELYDLVRSLIYNDVFKVIIQYQFKLQKPQHETYLNRKFIKEIRKFPFNCV